MAYPHDYGRPATSQRPQRQYNQPQQPKQMPQQQAARPQTVGQRPSGSRIPGAATTPPAQPAAAPKPQPAAAPKPQPTPPTPLPDYNAVRNFRPGVGPSGTGVFSRVNYGLGPGTPEAEARYYEKAPAYYGSMAARDALAGQGDVTDVIRATQAAPAPPAPQPYPDVYATPRPGLRAPVDAALAGQGDVTNIIQAQQPYMTSAPVDPQRAQAQAMLRAYYAGRSPEEVLRDLGVIA